MNKLDISDWKYFSLGDKEYFEICRIKKPIILSNYNVSAMKGENKFPIVCSSLENNGVAGWIIDNNNEEVLHYENAITVAQDGSIFSSFYQPFKFYTRINMLIFRLKKRQLNHHLAFFLCSIINLEKFKYSFGRTLKTGDIWKTKIPLPVNEKGEPNWLWMENYSRKIFEKVKKDIIGLIDKEREREREEINIYPDDLQEFKISNCFYILRAKITKKEDILPGEFAHITDKSGFNGYEGSSYFWTEKANIISIGTYSGSSFYQEKNFTNSSHQLIKIWPKNRQLNKYNAFFIATILNQGAPRYSYGRMRSLSELRKEKIPLPIDKNKKIDWDYTETITKNIYQKIILKFEKILTELDE
ncbi:restriction endonuclease subunit S [endosymbiont GvMRE of Glomus versiforme]|uniref:restriction endonuclease subunit S n=1 Tax=endosymbiont GvMRE of Glomus versiforme TaxID=2039283 RepID=UPI000EBBEAA1|nr:restriction endonuclease subunit S [endosymbiont GvMRE of Glomus versiforme]RHZ37338.1 BcgI-like restriction enzyme subunit beta [endosymbiont GvMRE of Glomus versiforme]